MDSDSMEEQVPAKLESLQVVAEDCSGNSLPLHAVAGAGAVSGDQALPSALFSNALKWDTSVRASVSENCRSRSMLVDIAEPGYPEPQN
mmetsp:Transcript_33553/g.62864  ORF Transcript_33553/g.62864 Transcript_33553/m.62864 type:complete len:89 (-) Transcript_33553:12-278(-)